MNPKPFKIVILKGFYFLNTSILFNFQQDKGAQFGVHHFF